MTDTIDKVAFAAAELLAASEALASAAAEVDALRAEVARQTGIAVDHCARADAAERARDEVGIQLAAARERIKLLEEGADLLREISDMARDVPAGFDAFYLVEKSAVDISVGCYLARLDAVPGDALAPRITAALDASGIDTNNVKGVE